MRYFLISNAPMIRLIVIWLAVAVFVAAVDRWKTRKDKS